MTDQTKKILSMFGGWAAFFMIVGLLVLSPMIYLRLHSGSWDGRQAVCGTESIGARNTDLWQIVSNPDYWNFQQVSVSGKLSYASGRGTFHLRDGIFTVPLDVSDCQGLDIFQDGETRALVKATVAAEDGDPYLVVTELRETIPGYVSVAFSAGGLGIFVILLLAFRGVVFLIRFFLVVIGVQKRKSVPSLEEARAKRAGGMLLRGIVTPIMWLLNPLFGASVHIFALIRGWSGLRSGKRTVAIIGATLCVTGMAVMTFVSIGLGWFEKPQLDLYRLYSRELASKKPTGREMLELKPYMNNDRHFSMHAPKGWTADEDQIAKGLLVFRGPQDGTFQDKPFKPELYVFALSFADIGVKNGADFVAALKKNAEGFKGFSIIADERISLAGGRTEADIYEFTDTKDAYTRHSLGMLIADNDIGYLVAMEAPAEKWGRYAPAINDSLRTFAFWKGTFAACLKSKGAVFYGAFDCDYCQEQKELFTDGIERLPFVECHDIDDGSQLDICDEKNIDSYPTWEFADESRLVGLQTLQTLATKTECPL